VRELKKIGLLGVGDEGWQGGIQYIINIIGALNAIADESAPEVHLLKNPAQQFGDLGRFSKVDLKIYDLEPELEPWGLSKRARWFVQRKWGGRVYPRMEDFFINNHFDYIFPATLSDCKGKLNTGAWIADFQYKHFPDGASKKVNEDADRVISFIANQASKIIVSSKFCETDCHHFFPVTKGKTHVMSFAVSMDESILRFSDFTGVREKYSLPERFLMVSNLFAPTKHHKTLFTALGLLKSRGVKVNLVCTGNIVDYRNHLYANEILQSLTDNSVRDQVHLLGLIPRADQLALYRMAVAMVQPSVNEGWSTPVEEAKSLGKNLVLSDIEVHKEQYPGNPYFFRSGDAEDLAMQIEKVCSHTENIVFPDLAAEKAAFQGYAQKIKDFGRRFLEIGRL
jgi:glycosyltransferase involved in cell wall biosynthesis